MNYRWVIAIGGLGSLLWILIAAAFMLDGAPMAAAALWTICVLGAAALLSLVLIGVVSWAMRGDR